MLTSLGDGMGWDGIDHRVNNSGYKEPSFTNLWIPAAKAYIDIFLYTLSFIWLSSILLAKSNGTIRSVNPNCNELTGKLQVKPFDWHFKHRLAVNDHNNLCHSLLLIEDSWKITWWENLVFSFVLTVCKINAFHFGKYFLYANGE